MAGKSGKAEGGSGDGDGDRPNLQAPMVEGNRKPFIVFSLQQIFEDLLKASLYSLKVSSSHTSLKKKKKILGISSHHKHPLSTYYT